MRPGARCSLDPRAKLVILLCAAVMVFTKAGIGWYIIVTACLIALTALQGAPKAAAVLAAVTGVSTIISLFFLGMVKNGAVASSLVFFLFVVQFMPTISAMVMLFETTSSSEMVSVLRRMRFPEGACVSVATAVRYFPVARDDFRCIRKAMRLRSIKGPLRKLESFYVPLLMSALQTAEDITASAVSRGIDNPCRKTSYSGARFNLVSVAAVCLFAATALFSMMEGARWM